MKIQAEHYEHMKAEIASVIAKNKEQVFTYKERLKADPKVKDVEKRFRWDLFHAARLNKFASDTIYSYANDEHIDTALKRVIKELNQ